MMRIGCKDGQTRYFPYFLYFQLALATAAEEPTVLVSQELPPQQAAILQSFRHFDRFVGDIWFPRGSLYMGGRNSSLRVRGWFGATHGIFANCWTCEASGCTSEVSCCRRKSDASCFDGIHYRKSACCDNRLIEYDNHPEMLTASLYTSLGIEQVYQRLHARRLEHLTSLALPLWNRRVLEVGARQGDLTHYFTDRNCTVTVVEPRMTNVMNLRKKLALGKLFPRPNMVSIFSMDLEKQIPFGKWDIVFCFGLLYHLERPLRFLRKIAPLVEDFLLLETLVSPERQAFQEAQQADSMALSGRATRVPRKEIFQTLQSLFPHVYVPITQPNHEQFEINWEGQTQQRRAIFIAARRPLSSPVTLMKELPMQQTWSA